MGSAGNGFYGLYRIGAAAGFFSSGACVALFAERNGIVKFFTDTLPTKEIQVSEHENTINKAHNTKLERSKLILKYGVPESLSPGVLHNENHILEFDPVKKTPIWVAEHITKDHVAPEGPTANRKKSKFRPDDRVPENLSPSNDDYWNSGWSRGHMAPAGNNKHNQDVSQVPP